MHAKDLVGFNITPLGYIKLRVTFGKHPLIKIVMVHFLVVGTMPPFNALIRRLTLNALGAVISTPYLVVKFLNDDLKVVTIRGD